MDRLRFLCRIAVQLALFPFLYRKHRAYGSWKEHFSTPDRLPDQADWIVALGCSLRADGSAAHPTRAIAERAGRLYQEGRAGRILLSGANPVRGVSEGEAMRRVVKEKFGLEEPAVRLDPLPPDRYVGTLDQVRSVGRALRESRSRRAILVVQPQQLPRALWLFRKNFPDIEFFPANPEEIYDRASTQTRMHSAWRFRLWNMIAWSGLWLRN